MILIKLFLEFFKIGLCAFGGGLATIPFLYELSAKRPDWFTSDQLVEMMAVSESTPGAMGVNMSTYVGYRASMNYFDGNVFLGFVGGIVGTLGLVTPSIIVILIICQFLKKFQESRIVKYSFYGLRAASMGLICNAAYEVLKVSVINPSEAKQAFKEDGGNIFSQITSYLLAFFDPMALAMALFFGIIVFKYKKHPIFYIVLAAILGIIFRMGGANY